MGAAVAQYARPGCPLANRPPRPAGPATATWTPKNLAAAFFLPLAVAAFSPPPSPLPSLLPPADTRGSFDAEAAPKPAQSGGVAARPFHVGSHLGNWSVPRSSCRWCVCHRASGRNLFERIPPKKQKVQPRPLSRAPPAWATMPRAWGRTKRVCETSTVSAAILALAALFAGGGSARRPAAAAAAAPP